MALKKLCSYHNCNKVVDIDTKYCEYHSKKVNEAEKQRHKIYQHNRLLNEEERKYQRFYNSSNWKLLKESVKKELYYIDIFELYKNNKIVQGDTVHHIITIKENYDMRLDKNNLIYLTESNHKLIHNKYNESKQEKEKIQKILLELLKLFKKEYKY